MRIMPDTVTSYSEYSMQLQVAEYFSHRKFGDSLTSKVYREIKIPSIGRISDIIIYLSDRKIINIECKLYDYRVVIKQAIDHLRWADYSYVCFFANTYLPAYILDLMITKGIGLLLWTPDIFVEVLQSGYNKSKDKVIKQEVLRKLKKRDQIKMGKKESNKQMILKYTNHETQR